MFPQMRQIQRFVVELQEAHVDRVGSVEVDGAEVERERDVDVGGGLWWVCEYRQTGQLNV